MQDIIQIKSQAKRNVIVSAMFGIIILALGKLSLLVLPNDYYLIGIFLISLSIVAFILAWVKYREPEFSFCLTRSALTYQHRFGQWQLDWHNIQRIDRPTIYQAGSLQNLDMVGIKLKDYSAFLEHISPRLMSNILMEQRPLLLQGNNSQCQTGQCYGDDLLEDDQYKDQHGKTYSGIQAMFANRMLKLRQRLGYDIFVASAELDRPEQDFIELLKQCQQQVVSQRSWPD
ncbi:DUF2982 domain-containing protein [Paraglaciecola aestuariivivens]